MPGSLARVVVAGVFAFSAIRVIWLHAVWLTGRVPAGFMAFLEMAGWLVLTIASGAALLHVGSAVLWVSTGAAGAMLILVGRLGS